MDNNIMRRFVDRLAVLRAELACLPEHAIPHSCSLLKSLACVRLSAIFRTWRHMTTVVKHQCSTLALCQ